MPYQDRTRYGTMKNVVTKSLATLLLGSVSFESLDVARAQSADMSGMSVQMNNHHHHAMNAPPAKSVAQKPAAEASSGKAGAAAHTAKAANAADDDMGDMYMGGASASDAEKVDVTASRLAPIRRAGAQLLSIPGGTNIIDSKMVLKQRNATSADLLSYQPGVYAQAPAGSDDLRLSIRGSGLQVGANATRAGVIVLFDDLPATTPIGSFNELMEPLGIQYTEVLRGGNGLDKGSLQLGGLINFHSFTGYDAKTYQARVEAGSFGYVKEQLSSGKVIGKSDYYISVTNSYRAGYQDQTKATSFGINANYGYRFNDSVDTRFFFRYRQTYEGNPYYLTRAQVRENPKQAQYPYNTWGTYTIEPGTKYFGNRTTVRIDDASRIMIGATYIDAPMDHQLGNTSSIYNNFYLSGVINYTRNDTILGHKSETTAGIYATGDLPGSNFMNLVRRQAAYPGVPVGTLLTKQKLGGSSTLFHVSNNTEIFKNFWLTAGGGLSYDPRSGSVVYPVQNHFSTAPLNFAPRGGFRYQFTPDIRIYGNVSRSVQSAQDWQFLSGSRYTSGLAQGQTEGWQKLEPQTATTFEVGSEGTYKGQHWSVSYYHSAVHNELLSAVTAVSQLYNSAVFTNASRTTHQGVEAGINGTLFKWNGNAITYMQSYTWSDFHYNHDPVFGHNRLPGVPEHYYQGELHADFKNGFYTTFDVEAASSIVASYDNGARTAPYHIYSYTLGYLWPKKDRRVYLQFHNLANKHYAMGVVPVYTSTNGDAAAELVGDGFGIFAGVDVGFN
ncbi:TonB-dependent receptor [Gluconacetobacter liquefaciens]|uniref:Iron complex outermembrane receptor protein n=1 Tax=Gluconacetobacter liquefaciens TaxID=89584 RepID=A0A370G9C1_GLULI|nr:TonB-dependent receptor [Gluconacetobacter liquefaciens]MBB2185992.1 TonB-dependent receptor [Gluconacetobacter liquefaciens]RDI39810.1 iron complex outermembrane receptor protein [Gluconacetobacter liquefaciens]GBQ94917.1 TonB-dependent outer membrane siderophore receptor [Gluconacetobacter liquefaciens NRIC 0522]GEB37595.1 TonB-dependent receptor [Gluconacetobacter liquefaciens]